MNRIQPTLDTKSLKLRPFTLTDAAAVKSLAGDARVASTTLSIPHPYPDGVAEDWIRLHGTWFAENKGVVYAITLKDSGALIGCIDLSIWSPHRKAEMGYWIGVEFWNQGYASEAAGALVGFAFESLRLNKLVARHRLENPSSGRVMEKAGFLREGILRKDLWKNGQAMDIALYGLLNPNLN